MGNRKRITSVRVTNSGKTLGIQDYVPEGKRKHTKKYVPIPVLNELQSVLMLASVMPEKVKERFIRYMDNTDEMYVSKFYKGRRTLNETRFRRKDLRNTPTKYIFRTLRDANGVPVKG